MLVKCFGNWRGQRANPRNATVVPNPSFWLAGEIPLPLHKKIEKYRVFYPFLVPSEWQFTRQKRFGIVIALCKTTLVLHHASKPFTNVLKVLWLPGVPSMVFYGRSGG